MNNIVSEKRLLVRYWWIFLILGTLLIALSVLVVNQPLASYANLTLYFIIAFLINGILETSFALSNRRTAHTWGWHLAGGIFDLAIGFILLTNPILAAISLQIFAGFWLLFRSIAIIGRSFDLPTVAWPEQGWMLLLGLGGLAFSFMILYNPALGAFTIVSWTALALFFIGLFYLFLGLHLKKGTSKE